MTESGIYSSFLSSLIHFGKNSPQKFFARYLIFMTYVTNPDVNADLIRQKIGNDKVFFFIFFIAILNIFLFLFHSKS